MSLARRTYDIAAWGFMGCGIFFMVLFHEEIPPKYAWAYYGAWGFWLFLLIPTWWSGRKRF